MNTDTVKTFDQLGLQQSLLKVLDEVGYETPSPIQAQTIPYMLEGRDVVGQAQTGTGKTAAFALPILSRLDLKQKDPQVLVLAPTRELAIQVAEAFQKVRSPHKGFSCPAHLWRSGLQCANSRPAAWCACDRRHTGTCHGSYSPRNAGAG